MFYQGAVAGVGASSEDGASASPFETTAFSGLLRVRLSGNGAD
jgi:hypothetical protein